MNVKATLERTKAILNGEKDEDRRFREARNITPVVEPSDIEKRRIAIEDLTRVMQKQGHSPEAIDEVVKATIESFSKE